MTKKADGRAWPLLRKKKNRKQLESYSNGKKKETIAFRKKKERKQ